MKLSRRNVIGGLATAGLGSIAGCSGTGGHKYQTVNERAPYGVQVIESLEGPRSYIDATTFSLELIHNGIADYVWVNYEIQVGSSSSNLFLDDITKIPVGALEEYGAKEYGVLLNKDKRAGTTALRCEDYDKILVDVYSAIDNGDGPERPTLSKSFEITKRFDIDINL